MSIKKPCRTVSQVLGEELTAIEQTYKEGMLREDIQNELKEKDGP